MAYNTSTLIRAYIVQEYWKLKHAQGISSSRIYYNIYHLYPVSKSTFYNYLALPAMRELKKIFPTKEIEGIKKLKDYAIQYLQLFEAIHTNSHSVVKEDRLVQ